MTARIEEAEERIGEYEDKIKENDEKRERKLLDHIGRIRDLNYSMKWNNICIIGVPEEEREKGAEDLFEQIIFENFPNLGKDTGIQVQESPRGTESSLQKQQNQVNTMAYTEIGKIQR